MIFHHEIKIEYPYYFAVREGRKTFEIRLDDRGYNAGDSVALIPTKDNIRVVTLPILRAKIGYVTSFKQIDGYVVFSLLEVHEMSDV